MKRWRARFFCLIFLSCTTAVCLAGAYEDLLRAVEFGDGAAVMDLLKRGVDVDSVDAQGNTLAMLAVRSGHREILELLLRNRANILKINEYGDSALMLAAIGADQGIVESLLSAGAEIDPEGWTPLIYAAFSGRANIVRLLIEREANVEARAPNGMTALMVAAQNGHAKAVDALLEGGANPDVWDRDGRRAEDLAAATGNGAIAQRLRRVREGGR